MSEAITTCASPVPFETLAELWAGELAPDAADLVEAHLFSCDACAQASERLGQLVTGLRRFIPPVISPAHRDRLQQEGLRLRATPVTAGVAADAFFAPDVDLLVHVLRGDLSSAERVDVEFFDPAGAWLMTFEHVPFDRDRGEVLIACQRHYETFSPVPGDPTFVVHAVEAGVRRSVGSFFVRHQWR